MRLQPVGLNNQQNKYLFKKSHGEQTVEHDKVSFAGNKKIRELFKQFDKYLKANHLVIKYQYQPQSEKYSTPAFHFAKLFKNGQQVSIKDHTWPLYGSGQNSKQAAKQNLIDKINKSSCKILLAGDFEIEPFRLSGQ